MTIHSKEDSSADVDAIQVCHSLNVINKENNMMAGL